MSCLRAQTKVKWETPLFQVNARKFNNILNNLFAYLLFVISIGIPSSVINSFHSYKCTISSSDPVASIIPPDCTASLSNEATSHAVGVNITPHETSEVNPNTNCCCRRYIILNLNLKNIECVSELLCIVRI